MSDNENEDEHESNQVGDNKLKNRASKDITELKIIVAMLAWNECSRSTTTDCKELHNQIYQQYYNGSWSFTDYGNITLDYIQKDKSVGTNKLKLDKIMADFALAFSVLRRINRILT